MPRKTKGVNLVAKNGRSRRQSTVNSIKTARSVGDLTSRRRKSDILDKVEEQRGTKRACGDGAYREPGPLRHDKGDKGRNKGKKSDSTPHHEKFEKGENSSNDERITNVTDDESSSDDDIDSSSDSEKDDDNLHAPIRIDSRLSIHVDNNLKQKIWKGKYLDLEKLLPETSFTKAEPVNLTLRSNGKLTLAKHSHTRSITHINDWITAFLIYMDVYMEMYPKRGRELLHYMAIIRRMASQNKGPAWYLYDKEFRRSLPHYQSLSWMIKDSEIYDRCVYDSMSGQLSFDHTKMHETINTTQYGPCRFFNELRGCYRKTCEFAHEC